MKRAFAITAALLALGTSINARANVYPFDEPSDFLAPAVALDGWAATLSRHEAQQAALYACANDKKACRGRLSSFNKAMVRAQDLKVKEQIELVHFYINRTRYDDDHVKRLYDDDGKKIGVIRNHWSTLREFLVGGGDCEDYATAKYFMLRELGFAADDLRVVVTWERKLRGYHAVLAVRHADGMVWLLDSDNFIRRNGHRGYRYVYAMNEKGIWDHREDFSGTTLPTAD